jgi:UDP-N-acetylmuramoyl-L-alanyl-D-glutamate--2,6-diaminopimelate ligase
MMLSTELFKTTKISCSTPPLPISGICTDSRQARSGDLFVCVTETNAPAYIQEAFSKGCAMAVAMPAFCTSPLIVPVDNPRAALAKIASTFYDKQPSMNIAVTGTNGKSSTVSLVRQMLQYAEIQTASLGTLGLETSHDIEGLNDLPKLTTPDAVSLHKTLQRLAESHTRALAFEASSHGLDQYRLHGVRLKAAGFTNLTQDHLDYHGTLENYFNAKAKLFSEILPIGGVAVVNRSMDYYNTLVSIIAERQQKLIIYGLDPLENPDLLAFNIRFEESYIAFDLKSFDTIYRDIHLKLYGQFQIENVLCALGLSHACGVSMDTLVAAIPSLYNIAGRMEYIGHSKTGGHVFVDYAHTPDALECALTALQPHTKNHLHVVFGCGGNRDKTKRPIMGKIAQDLADYVIVTDDNPRNEDPKDIRASILAACPEAQDIADRHKAIRIAVEHLVKGDCLLIAGKGHEAGQIIGDTVLPFDDRIEAREALQ